jgi:16S rRNA processing protein RimM
MEGNKFYYHEIQGFKAIDSEYGEIGLVQQVVNQSVQPLFSILKRNKEILIPVADEIIKEVDRENKCIYLNCPEGLIDIYI